MRALIYIINTFSMLVTFVFLLRFWLPWFRVDFRNPIAQGILRITSPVINPLRRFVPAIGRVDTATVLVAFLIQAGTLLLILLLLRSALSAQYIIVSSILKLLVLSLRMFAYAIVIRIVLSWIAPGLHNPATMLIHSMTEPLLRPFRRYIPPVGGFDLSPIFATILIFAFSMLIEDSLPYLV